MKETKKREEKYVEVITIGDNVTDIVRLDCCSGVIKMDSGQLLYSIRVGGPYEFCFAVKGDRLCRLRSGRWTVEEAMETPVQTIEDSPEEGDGTAACGERKTEEEPEAGATEADRQEPKAGAMEADRQEPEAGATEADRQEQEEKEARP